MGDRRLVVTLGPAEQVRVGRQLRQRGAGVQLTQHRQVQAALVAVLAACFVVEQAHFPVPVEMRALQAREQPALFIDRLGAARGILEAVGHRGARIRERVVRVAGRQDRLVARCHAGRIEVGHRRGIDRDRIGRVQALGAGVGALDERAHVRTQLDRAAAQETRILALARAFQVLVGVVVTERAVHEHAGRSQTHGRRAGQLARRIAVRAQAQAVGGVGAGRGELARARCGFAVERGRT